MGLFRHIFQHGLAPGQHSAEHGVHGSPHRHGIKEHMRARKLFAAHVDHAVLHRVARPQSAESLQVLVDGAGPQVAAAGHGHLRRAEAAQQRAQKVIAGPHLAGEIIRHFRAAHMGGVDLVGVFIEHAHPRAQGAQDLQRHSDIADGRQVFDHAFVRRQNGGGQDRHRRVLCAADGNLAGQGLAPVDHKFLQ